MANVRFLLVSKPPGLVQAPEDEFRARASIRVSRLPEVDSSRSRLENVNYEELENHLRSYYEAYYYELEGRMSRYPAMHEIFPDLLLGPRRVISILASDGIVATHWPTREQSFEFRVSTGRMMKDITESERAVEGPSGMWVDLFDYDAGSDFGAFELWRIEVIDNGTVVKPDWTRVDVASLDNLDLFRDEAQARENAERDVQIATDAYLMGLAPAPPGKDQQDRVIAELEAAIDEFEKVLETHANDEKMIQLYLGIKRNQILLDPSALSIRPQVKFGSEYVPDFVIEVAEEQYVLVEIERPALPLLTEKGRPRAELTHAQQQVKDWFDWTGRHSEYARLLLPGVSEPEGWVVMGRRSSIAPEHKHVLARENAESRRIKTKTYDDLLDRAKQHLENLRRL
jgi:hypothetical protein